MKRLLLTFVVVTLAALTAGALTTDNQTYEPVNGVNMVSQWIYDRVHTPAAYMADAICNQRARTATMIDGVIYVGRSEEKVVIVGSDTIMQSVIHRFNVEDGSPLPDLELTLNGAPYGRFLGVASVGRDNFGHLWVAPMTSNAQLTVPIYMVNTDTGEMTLVVEMDKGEAPQRTDYCDVIGDITLQQAECNIMTVAGATAEPGSPTVYRMHAPQGGTADSWTGGFDGDSYLDFIDFYPETKTGFSLAPVVKMVLSDDPDTRYAGELFYIDCFDTPPTLFGLDGTIYDTFEEVPQELKPQTAPNGCIEFRLDGRDFFVYVNSDMHGNGHGCQANICEMGPGQTFAGMQKYWQVPADSLGKVNDSGLRVHCFAVDKTVDEQGDEVVTLFTFKAYNGMAVYKIGKNVTQGQTGVKGDVTGDGEVDIADVSALINIMLGSAQPGDYPGNANIDGLGDVDIADVSAIINIMLGK